MTGEALGPTLLALARNAIGRRFGIEPDDIHELPEHQQAAATFVTLTRDGQLRGCIGSLEAFRGLADDVTENALAAAFRDPRFAPLNSDELALVRIEVSLLDPSEPLGFSDEHDALARLRPGSDGLILTYGQRRATFLPQVWESLPDPRNFLAQLKIKAGLPADFWDSRLRLDRYGVRKWKET